MPCKKHHLIITGILALCTAVVLGFNTERTHAAAGQYLKLAAYDDGLTFFEGRCFRMDFLVQTDSLNANSVDIDLPFDPAFVQPFADSACTVAANAIHTTGLFPSVPANIIGSNRILITAYDPSGTAPVNTGPAPADASLGYIYWKVLQTHPAFPLSYHFTYGPYNTLDTNMAEQNGDGTDVLDGVENVLFALQADTHPPVFTPMVPSDGATNVSVTSPVTFVWTDTGAGLAYDTLAFSMNGTSYTPVLSNCIVTNSNRRPSCNGAVNPGLLAYDTHYAVTATGSDLAVIPNKGTATWSFTTEDDVHAPYIQNFTPINGADGISISATISFDIRDSKNNAGIIPGLGTDLDSIIITVTVGDATPVTYRASDPEVTVTGTPDHYRVVLQPTVTFPEHTLITVTVDAGDMHAPPNVMSTYVAAFRTVDSVGPVISDFWPAEHSEDVPANANVSLRITDDGAGVNIDQTVVTIAGIAYDVSHPSFSYVGNAHSYVITVDPVSNFAGSQHVTTTVSTSDLADPANDASASWSFMIASTCHTCLVDTEEPARFATNAPLGHSLSFHVRDTGDGIDPQSIVVRLIGPAPAIPTSPWVLTHASHALTIAGTAADYAVTLTLPAAIAAHTPYAIVIDAANVDGLTMQTVAYSFAHTEKTTAPGTECTPNTSPDSPPHGGYRGGMTLPSKPAPAWPEIVRRWLGADGTVTREENIPADEARTIERCYVDGGHSAAPRTHYDDVPAGIWYEEALERLLQRGALDATQASFRAADAAVRAAFATILVRLQSTQTPDPAVPASFDDTETSAWYHPFVEEAARKGWMLGYDNCYGTRPCRTAPLQTATRAEAAAMVVRTYGLHKRSLAPAFADVPITAWYADMIQIAADHCLLQGDDRTGLAAPDRIVNRAEMAILLDRADQQLQYGRDCGQDTTHVGAMGASLLSPILSSATISVSSAILLMSGIGWLIRHRKKVDQMAYNSRIR